MWRVRSATVCRIPPMHCAPQQKKLIKTSHETYTVDAWCPPLFHGRRRVSSSPALLAMLSCTRSRQIGNPRQAKIVSASSVSKNTLRSGPLFMPERVLTATRTSLREVVKMILRIGYPGYGSPRPRLSSPSSFYPRK